MALMGRIIHGNLRITGFIGKGAMGLMLLAENVELPERKCAVKVLLNPITTTPRFQERFSEEARNQARLDHPNIVRVHDYFREAGRYFLVMEHVDGEPLQKIIQDCKRLDEATALAILDEVLQALQCAHAHGIIHRDVKPSNILIDKNGHARLTDFGIAVRTGGMRLTGTGMSAIGTAAYMSPEQIRTPLQIDPRSDVYSCGIVLFEMLTGDVPFRGDSDYAVAQHQVATPAPDARSINPAISSRVARIIASALAKNPRDRPQSCEQFRQLLAGGVKPPRAWKPLGWGAVAAAVCVAVYVAAAQWPRSTPRHPPSIDTETAQARDTALGALQSFALLCRESATKVKKEQGRDIARRIPDPAMAQNFASQIEESENNMAEFARQYGRGLAKLAAMDDPALTRAVEGAAAESDRGEYVGLVVRDAKTMKAAPGQINASAMAHSCGS